MGIPLGSHFCIIAVAEWLTRRALCNSHHRVWGQWNWCESLTRGRPKGSSLATTALLLFNLHWLHRLQCIEKQNIKMRRNSNLQQAKVIWVVWVALRLFYWRSCGVGISKVVVLHTISIQSNATQHDWATFELQQKPRSINEGCGCLSLCFRIVTPSQRGGIMNTNHIILNTIQDKCALMKTKKSWFAL